MGLSKKLGGTSQKMGLPVSDAVPYKWSNQTYTVEEILKKFKLPCVVQCATDSCTVVWSDFQFDLRQPLLFYSKRSVQKVHAVSLKQTNDVLEEIGPPLAIPEDYEGWFGAAPKGKIMAKRHFRVEGMANSSAHQFLVTSKCPAFTSSRASGGHLHYMPHEVTSGEILKRVCVMDTDTAHPDCPGLVKEHGPCLELLDEKGDDVIIPLSHSVLTYEIGNIYPDEETRIFKITSPIQAGNSKLPRILNLIQGDPPLLAYAFTGTVRCYSVFTEETILAATLEDPGSRCLELATDSCVKFRLCLNEAIVKKTCEYANAFQMCENFGAKFITGIKVSFILKPEMSNLGDADLSFYESASDVQEVEANSEFDIAWGSIKKARLFIGAGSLGKGNNSFSEDVSSPLDEKLSKEMAQYRMKPVSEEHSEDSDVSDSVVPQHRDFTEREIVDLMLMKGLMGPADKTNQVTSEMDLLKENRVTDNPLFYFFQRNPDQNPWKPEEPENPWKSEEPENPWQSEEPENHWKSEEPENDDSASDEPSQEISSQENPYNQKNQLLHTFKKETINVPSKAEVKNPLSYLFEQTLGQPLNHDKSGTKISHENLISPSPDLQSSSVLRSVSGTDVSNFGQVVYKTARVYTGSDDDDEDETDDDSSESDENDSDISELCNDNKEPSFPKENDTPKKNAKHPICIEASSVSSAEVESQIADSSEFPDISGSSLKYNEKALGGRSGDTTVIEKADQLNFSSDDADAFVDLLTLAEMESNKYSTTGVLDNVESSRGNPVSKSKTGKGDGDSVQRLNNLLEEVSQLVNVSTGRILDAKKIPVHQQLEKVISAAEHKQVAPLPSPRLLKIKRNDRSSIYNSIAPISRKSSEINRADDEFKMAANNHSESTYDNSLKRADVKSKLDNSDDFYPKLNQFKSDNTIGALTRAHGELSPDHVGQEQINENYTTPHRSHRTSPSESSISSIFSVGHNPRNKFHSALASYSPQNHPMRQQNEINHTKNDYLNPSVIDEEQKYSFPYKNQRILSLTHGRNVLASFQNLERSSSTSSTTSICSSSFDNSCVQGVPKLVVIGDPGLVIEDDHRLTQLSSENFTASSTTQFPRFVSNSHRRYTAEGEGYHENLMVTEYYEVSRNENRSPERLTLSQEEYLQVLEGNIDLQEDYV